MKRQDGDNVLCCTVQLSVNYPASCCSPQRETGEQGDTQQHSLECEGGAQILAHVEGYSTHAQGWGHADRSHAAAGAGTEAAQRGVSKRGMSFAETQIKMHASY
jgi:hypothetical protein